AAWPSDSRLVSLSLVVDMLGRLCSVGLGFAVEFAMSSWNWGEPLSPRWTLQYIVISLTIK
ncbi:MAG: hypothetical protein ACKOOI_04030, partial [Pirellula sp.]